MIRRIGSVPQRYWVGLLIVVCLILIIEDSRSRTQNQRDSSQIQVIRESDDFVLTNSRFILTEKSTVYDVNPSPKCWVPNCDRRNNIMAYQQCGTDIATEWNAIGVQSMERYLEGEIVNLITYNNKSLDDAVWYFKNATAVDGSCGIAYLNLGISLIQQGNYKDASNALSRASSILEEDYERSTVSVFRGILRELQGNYEEASQLYQKAIQDYELIKRSYFGVVAVKNDTTMRTYGPSETIIALRDLALYKYFGRTSIGEWALLKPGTQDWFVKNQWIILRKIIPPFVLKAAQKYYHSIVKNNNAKRGDRQSLRYHAYSDRIGRFIHNQIADMIRRVAAHNVIPTYSYFGGYFEGSYLKPHVDREQCEFTLSFTVENHPYNETWTLSLDSSPLFDRYREKTRPSDVFPNDPKRERNADLYSGDAVLLMGRRIVHYRREVCPPGLWINQVFMHYVLETFKGSLN